MVSKMVPLKSGFWRPKGSRPDGFGEGSARQGVSRGGKEGTSPSEFGENRRFFWNVFDGDFRTPSQRGTADSKRFAPRRPQFIDSEGLEVKLFRTRITSDRYEIMNIWRIIQWN